MFISLKTNPQNTAFILSKSNYSSGKHTLSDDDLAQKHEPRKLSEVGTDSYNRSLRRAFNRAKTLAFFNPDLNQFITLTYAKPIDDPNKVIDDVKEMVKRHKKSSDIPFKYIYVFEIQEKRKAKYGHSVIHIHMIANRALSTVPNRNKHLSVKEWPHGFSSVLDIEDFDNNFRPYLYLFKYMSKAQRVGKSFIHVSRNFDKIEPVEYGKYINHFEDKEFTHKEDYAFTVAEKNYSISKEYYRTTPEPIKPIP